MDVPSSSFPTSRTKACTFAAAQRRSIQSVVSYIPHPRRLSDTHQVPLTLQEALARSKAKREAGETTVEEKNEAPEESTPERDTSTELEAPMEKFGIQTDKGKVIKVYRDGDKHHEGDRFVVHPTKYKTLDQLLSDITTKVGVVTGPVRKLVYLKQDGTFSVVGSLEEVRDKTRVLACGPAPPKVDLGESS